MTDKNYFIEGEVIAYGSAGEGIIKDGQKTAFVPFCLVGERVRAKVLKSKGDILYCKKDGIILPSSERVTPPCPVFEKCGGCDLQHMSYEAQLAFKRELLISNLKKIGGIEAEVENITPCDKIYRYRNKATLPIGQGADGVEVGFFARRSHRIVPIDDCPIQSKEIKKVISSVKKFAKDCGLKGYDGLTGKGDLRQIAVREIQRQYIFAVVATRKIDLAPLERELEKHFENFTLLLNVNPSSGNAIFSNEWHICRGEGIFEAEEEGIKFGAGANTFIQVNDFMRRKLYKSVLSEARSAGGVALDLYSGGGLLTAMLAKCCGKAYGIEIVPEATARADELKIKNDLEGAMINICGKVESELKNVLARTEGSRRVIVSDPPRKGMEREVTLALKSSGAEKIILVSCDSATLARDLGLISGTLEERDGKLVKTGKMCGDYKISRIAPFDMFPQTRHVETLAVLEKN